MQARLEQIIERDRVLAAEGKKLLAERAKVIDVSPAVPTGPASSEHEPAPVVATSSPPAPTTSPAPPIDRIVYEATPPGGIAYPNWARPPAHAAPSTPDPFADIRRLPDPQRGELGFARLVGPWKDRAQLARDQGKAYAGPRSIPSFVAKWLTDSGRDGVLEHMTRVLGFFVEPEDARSN